MKVYLLWTSRVVDHYSTRDLVAVYQEDSYQGAIHVLAGYALMTRSDLQLKKMMAPSIARVDGPDQSWWLEEMEAV